LIASLPIVVDSTARPKAKLVLQSAPR